MVNSVIDSYKIKAKLLQKAKKKAGKPIKLKDAFAILAQAAGYTTWKEMRDSLEESDLFCSDNASAIWKTWYSSYSEAKEHLSKQLDLYLLPFRKQYFICDNNWIEYLGISIDDCDLKLVGNNWIEPKHSEAWQRLLRKLKTYKEKRKE